MINKYKIDNRENKELFVFPYGLDDFLVFISCLKKYKEENEDKLLFLYVLSPNQSGFDSPSFMKEFASEYDFIEDIFELEEVVITKKESIQVDKKKIESQVAALNKYYNFSKIEVIELTNHIKRDDYRYNTYFQFCTILHLEHTTPEYHMPKIKRGCSHKWKKDYGIKRDDKYIVVQLNSRFSIKKADKKLFETIAEKIKLPNDVKIVEVGKKELEDSVLVDPEEVRTKTLIDIINGAYLTVCNNSLVYTISGILDKKTFCIINPNSAPIIRDYVFNFSQGNITYLATDPTLEEWERLRKLCPFVVGNPIFKREIEADISSINIYNPTQKLNRLNRKQFTEKFNFIKKIKNGEEIERPLLWYSIDEGSLRSGGHKKGNSNLKFQLLEGIPQVLAYQELGYTKIPVLVTNIFKPFY